MQVGAEPYPETQAKELGLGALLLEGAHSLHGVGHHSGRPRPYLPAPPRVHQPRVPTRMVTYSSLTYNHPKTGLAYHDVNGADHAA